MATDPVQQINRKRHRTPFQKDLAGKIDTLAAAEPSVEIPYLTLSIDWQPEGGNPTRRAGRQYVENALGELLDNYEPHTPPHESLSRDGEKIRHYLDEEVDAAVHGIVIVACNGTGLFETMPLSQPVENSVSVAPTPALFRLARLVDDEAPYAVLLADQREAHLSLLVRAHRRHSVELLANDYPRKQAQGGWSQRRFQARADERVDAFARTIAGETRQLLDQTDIDSLILAGEEQMRTAIADALHESVKSRLIASIHLDVNAPIDAVIEETGPLAEKAERERELAAVHAVQEGAGPGGKSVLGPVDTLTALQGGQVMTLVLNDDVEEPGWADFTFPLYGTGTPPKKHPAGGDSQNLVPVALEEELVRQAILTGAGIEIVRTSVPISDEELADIPDASEPAPRSPAARQLDEWGGVAATLRFTLDADQSTAEL